MLDAKIRSREKTKVHMEKNLQKHLSLLSSFASEKIKSLSTEAEEMNAEIKRLSTDAAEKEKQINHLLSRVQDLENLPQEFTMHRYRQYEKKHIRWEDCPEVFTRRLI